MPSEKRRKRRADQAARVFPEVRARAAQFGLDLCRHDDCQYSLEWHSSRSRWELYPSTQRIIINQDRKSSTPSIGFGAREWQLVDVVERAVEILGLERIAGPESPPPGESDESFKFVETDETLADEMENHTLGISHKTEPPKPKAKSCPVLLAGVLAAPSDVSFDEIAYECQDDCRFRALCGQLETLSLDETVAFVTDQISRAITEGIYNARSK
jgi:hypothetical protein